MLRLVPAFPSGSVAKKITRPMGEVFTLEEIEQVQLLTNLFFVNFARNKQMVQIKMNLDVEMLSERLKTFTVTVQVCC